MENLIIAAFLLAILWCVGIIAWANSLSGHYCRLRDAFTRARQVGDIASAVILSQAMREIRCDLHGWHAANPMHWLLTLSRDYTARAAWELDGIR